MQVDKWRVERANEAEWTWPSLVVEADTGPCVVPLHLKQPTSTGHLIGMLAPRTIRRGSAVREYPMVAHNAVLVPVIRAGIVTLSQRVEEFDGLTPRYGEVVQTAHGPLGYLVEWSPRGVKVQLDIVHLNIHAPHVGLSVQ